MAKYQYEQFLLLGDSLTEYSSVEENGLTPVLQKGSSSSNSLRHVADADVKYI